MSGAFSVRPGRPRGQCRGVPWYLLLDRVEEPLLADLHAVAGVRAAQVVRGAPYPAVRLDHDSASLDDRYTQVHRCGR